MGHRAQFCFFKIHEAKEHKSPQIVTFSSNVISTEDRNAGALTLWFVTHIPVKDGWRKTALESWNLYLFLYVGCMEEEILEPSHCDLFLLIKVAKICYILACDLLFPCMMNAGRKHWSTYIVIFILQFKMHGGTQELEPLHCALFLLWGGNHRNFEFSSNVGQLSR